ncbi:MAG: ribosomal protection-like ABC-F family protein [Candidatus Saccharimonadales bacterium]|jgi:ATPase subunit of ABC transporter with duplicated ATPase domains
MLTAKNLGFEYDNRPVFSGIDLSINSGEKVGIVGPNGCGKSTLLKVLAGVLQPTEGEILSTGIEVGYMPQQLDEWVEFRVEEFLKKVTGVESAFSDLDQSAQEISSGSNDQTLLIYQAALDRVEKLGNNFENKIKTALRKAGIDNIDTDTYISDLSGGQRTRLAMAATFASNQDVVLLDEPTNNLDKEGIIVLERYIKEARASFVVASNDRRFLRNSISTIIEMAETGGINRFALGYDEYVVAREVARQAAVKRYEKHEKEVRRLRLMARSAIQRANGAERSRTKSDSDKLSHNYSAGRAQSSASKAAKATKSRLDHLATRRPDNPSKKSNVNFRIHEAETAGEFRTAISMQDLMIKYPESDRLFGPYNLNIQNGERVLLSGPNGVGKTTLIRSIFNSGMIKSGQCTIARNCAIGYIDQSHILPEMVAKPVDNIMQLCLGIDRSAATNLLVKFNIPRSSFDTPVGQMSPGERSKILLAAVTYSKPDLLVLDEPTNYLDIPTIEGVEIALREFPGTMLIVSHDRDFIEAIGVDREIKLKSNIISPYIQ